MSSFSVGVWNKERVFELGRNIGFETEHFAVEHSKSPEKWIYPQYKSGPADYDLWIKALEQGNADAFGIAFNTLVWSVCRSYAVPFLNEAKSRLPVEFHSLYDDAIAR